MPGTVDRTFEKRLKRRQKLSERKLLPKGVMPSFPKYMEGFKQEPKPEPTAKPMSRLSNYRRGKYLPHAGNRLYNKPYSQHIHNPIPEYQPPEGTVYNEGLVGRRGYPSRQFFLHTDGVKRHYPQNNVGGL